ncbi:hypothetical protein D7V94_05245 [Parablautia intestinalis]|uniref:Uncharacterized protein n=1 Tax=Parablautia intestinalis TaxID=2320100 RepID=A0A3A9B205_9FIRM|nr:hypothetical protein [Parablautia intestinalis]RKI92735.1 hypothetical protein D7V94_05245 [Parablautia intestinalis]
MNCLILVLLLLCCGNKGGCFSSNCDDGCSRDRNERCECSSRNGNCGRDNEGCGCGNRGGGSGNCGNVRPDNDDCGCRNDFRPEPRFESRSFSFNQSDMCGCEEPQNNNDGR